MRVLDKNIRRYEGVAMTKKTGLITGASSGIGREMAIAMARMGYDLALIARRTDRLDALKSSIEEETGRRVLCFPCDVRGTRDMQKTVLRAVKELGKLDVVVCNAGYTIPGAFESLEVEDYKNLFDANFFGMLNTLYPALRSLKSQGGTVVLMGSILGEFGIMDRSAYVSSKFAIRGFYESIRYELKEEGVSLLLVEPGFVKTELRFMDKAGNRLKVVTQKTVKKTSHGIAVQPDAVARRIVGLFGKRGYAKRIITGHAKAFAFLNWLCPSWLAAFVYRNRDWIRRKVIK